MENYGQLIKIGKIKPCIWGLGHIGYSTFIHYANENLQCIGFDPDKRKVEMVNQGNIPVNGLAQQIEIDPLPLVKNGLLKAVSDSNKMFENLSESRVHFIAVPTEKNSEPWWESLQQVFTIFAEKIVENLDYVPLVIIESTITAGTIDQVIAPIFEKRNLNLGKDIMIAHAPRRDWFTVERFPLRTLARVYSGYDEHTADQALSVLSIVCDNLYRASDYKVGELVKPVENAFRHVAISLANQLSIAYPDVNMRDVLALAGTKWNLETYHPSFGTGGYCIPLSSKYVIKGAKNPSALSILDEAIDTDTKIRFVIAEEIVNRGLKNIGILGVSYKGDLKVSVMSPTIAICKHLINSKIRVKVFDPYYSLEEVKEITGADTFQFPDGLSAFDTIIVMTDHAMFKDSTLREYLVNDSSRKDRTVIFDNYGIWKEWVWPDNIDYYISGGSKLITNDLCSLYKREAIL